MLVNAGNVFCPIELLLELTERINGRTPLKWMRQPMFVRCKLIDNLFARKRFECINSTIGVYLKQVQITIQREENSFEVIPKMTFTEFIDLTLKNKLTKPAVKTARRRQEGPWRLATAIRKYVCCLTGICFMFVKKTRMYMHVKSIFGVLHN